MVNNGVIACRNCGAYIGHYVERCVDGEWRTCAAVGGAVLHAAHGVCMACGQEWHWHSSAKRVGELIGKTFVLDYKSENGVK